MEVIYINIGECRLVISMLWLSLCVLVYVSWSSLYIGVIGGWPSPYVMMYGIGHFLIFWCMGFSYLCVTVLGVGHHCYFWCMRLVIFICSGAWGLVISVYFVCSFPSDFSAVLHSCTVILLLPFHPFNISTTSVTTQQLGS